MAITPGAGYEIDPNNPNAVRKIGSGAMPGSVAAIQQSNTQPSIAYGAINSTNTQAQPVINLNPKPDNTNYQGMINGATAQAMSIQQQLTASQTPAEKPKETPATSIQDYIASLSSIKQPNYEQSYGEASNSQSGIEKQQTKDALNAKSAITAEAQGRLNNISAQLQALNTEATAVPIALQQDSIGRGRTESGIAPLQADELRKIALRALPLQAQGAIVQAEVANAEGQQQLAQDLYTQASEHFEKMFTLQMQDAENKYTFQTTLLNKVYEFADKEQQRQLASIEQQADRDFQTQSNTIAHNRQVEMDKLNNQQQVALANMKNTAGTGTGGVSDTTQAIITNPSLFDDLTPTERGKVITQLQSQGYDTSNLGVKGLSDGAILSISQTQKALDDLAGLKTLIEGKSDQLGPLKGLAKLNPYSSARQLQADFDRVRQTVGKALEGGVLRKEDEDKYKKILATITDTPETAAYKIDALISSIQRDIENYKSLQQSSGRSANVGASLQKKGAVTPVTDLRTKYNY